jgi:hypothetical protein
MDISGVIRLRPLGYGATPFPRWRERRLVGGQ